MIALAGLAIWDVWPEDGKTGCTMNDFSRICQKKLPFTPWMAEKTRRLPGIQPVPAGEWLLRDEVFAEQMAYRDHLLATQRREVFRANPDSRSARQELLELVLAELGEGYDVSESRVVRPDGVSVEIAADDPIVAAARLVQEDLLILEEREEFALTAAVLCFPASWTLDEKFRRGLVGIHGTVEEYDADMARRVGRMFMAIRPEQPLWRANFLLYDDPDLHQPRREGELRMKTKGAGFVRVERQTLRKLPQSGAVVFGIHTYVVALENLNADERVELERLHSPH